MEIIQQQHSVEHNPHGFYVTAYPQTALPVMVAAPAAPMMMPHHTPVLVPVYSNPVQLPPMLTLSDCSQFSELSLPPMVFSGSNPEPMMQQQATEDLDLVKDSLTLPAIDSNHFSRSPSLSSSWSESSLSMNSNSDWSAYNEEACPVREEQPRGHKKHLIKQVQETLEALLGLHFPLKTEGNIMHVFAQKHFPDLDELEDVLRGNNIGNIRAKSVQSLSVLVEFIQVILNTPQVCVNRVDVILQRKKSGHLKGLLVNIEFSNQEQLLYVRDAIWKGMGYEECLPKFMPAVFAQDASWQGRPTDLHLKKCPMGELRVQDPLPQKLQDLGMEPQCRVKSISVVWFTSSQKRKTIEIPKEQFRSVLSEGKFFIKGSPCKLNAKTQVTVSFEEDWKTSFWRS